MNTSKSLDEILHIFDFHYVTAGGKTVITQEPPLDAIPRAKQAIIEAIEAARIDELMKFDDWLRERSHLDGRTAPFQRVRNHIWLRKEEIERKAIKEWQ